MSYMELFKVPEPTRDLSRKAAIIGLGESDFHDDYQAARAKAPGSVRIAQTRSGGAAMVRVTS